MHDEFVLQKTAQVQCKQILYMNYAFIMDIFCDCGH